MLLALVSIGAHAQVNLTIVPQQVNLAAPAGWSTPVTETVSLDATGGNAPFSASVRYLDASSGWLSVTPQAGTPPALLIISADASKLMAGRYLGQVTVTAGRVGTYVNVTFTVGADSGAALIAEPSGLTFVSRLSSETLPDTLLSVSSASGQASAVTFTAAANSPGNWLTVSPWSANTPAQLTVTATRTPVMTGEYTGAITLTPSNGGNATVIPVTLLALGSENAPPSLTLTQRGMTFNYQTAKPAPPLQAVGVSTTGVQQFTATTSTAWLRLISPVNPVPSIGVTDYAPGLFSVQVEPANIPTGGGPHSGIVDVSAPGLPAQQVAVTLTISAVPALNARPSWLDLNDSNQTEAYIEVTATGSATLPFTATISPPVSWLTVTPAAGTTGDDPPVLHVSTNTAGLAAGTYSTGLRLSILGSTASLNIPVRIQVSGVVAETPGLKILPPVVDLSGIVGGANPSQTVAVQPSGSDTTHRFTAAASSIGGWLTVKPASGVAPSLVTIGANVAAISAPGEYTGSVIITSLITGDQETIPVTLTLSVREVAAEPASLRFVKPQTGAPPAPQTVSITAPFPTPVSITSASNWIRFTPDRASTPATLTIFVDSAQLSPGTLTGSIDVAGPNNRLTIPVSLTIPEPEPPAVSPDSLTFSYELANAIPASQVLNVGAAASLVTFTASMTSESEVNWLNISPRSGSAPGEIKISVDPMNLTPGTYAGNVLVSFSGSSKTVTVPISLNVTAPKLHIRELLHGATLAPTPVAPGQIVVLTGGGLGPVTEVVARPSPGGVFGSQLSGVRLFIDGVPAPLLSVRNDRINAVVPYAIHGRTTARLQVEVEDKLSIPIEVKVVDSAPSIFTASGLGRGQAAALNADLTPNSALNAASRGSVIAIFGTGEGQTDPPGQDGRIILTDLRRPLLPVTALIGDRPAEVVYAGSASTMVSGVFQANIRIPEDIDPGAVPIEVRVGDASSTPGITVAVR